MYENEETQEDLLSAYFEKSATAVRRSFGRFERELARPTVRYVLASFKEHPIRSTFLAAYAALSALPILSFIGFSIFIFSSFVFFALCTAILSALSVVLFFGFWLACILLFLLVLSVPITASTLSTYLALRFIFFARRQGSARSALSRWARETKGHLYKRPPPDEEYDDIEDETPGSKEQQHPADSEAETLVVGSIVLDTPTLGPGENKIAHVYANSSEPDGLAAAETVRTE
ncbi:hypothetical protein BV20DRAFT_974368 [Pilatotrama ljubarskyi]|nr:hypothetical protein BV20DRAFT_974368 [Pilatotrama ljubarskyi]